MVHQMATTCVFRAGEGESAQDSVATLNLTSDGGDGPLAVTAPATRVILHLISLISSLGNHNGIPSLQRFNFCFVLDIRVVAVDLTYKIYSC